MTPSPNFREYGPRITFKPGETGAWLFADALLELGPALSVLARRAPTLRGNELVVTEVWRPGAGLHPKLRAFDVRAVDLQGRVGSVVGPTRQERITTALDWARRARLELPAWFDVVYGDPNHLDHVHVELDPRKRQAAAGYILDTRPPGQ